LFLRSARSRSSPDIEVTVYRLMSAGELPAVRVGRSCRLGEEDIDNYRPASFIEAG